MTAKKATTRKQVVAINDAKKDAAQLEKRTETARKAYELRKAGKSWFQIAEELKISERQASDMSAEIIKQAAQLVDEGAKQSLLTMEVDRLNDLQQAVWNDAMGGDRQAVETALKIIQSRAKVLGLDSIPTNTVTNNTIVVAGTSEEYVAALRRVAEIPVIDYEDNDGQ